MSEYIDFIAYQDDAIIQRPLRYYRRRGQPHPQPKGGKSHSKHQANVPEALPNFAQGFGYLCPK